MDKHTHEDGTPFTKEEFLKKLEIDNEFNEEFGNKGTDQISELIKQLKDNPNSRRLLISAWNISDLPHQVLPPCHYGFQVYTRELSLEERCELASKSIATTDGINASLLWELSCQGKKESEILKALNDSSRNIPTRAISLMWNQRSVDTPLGLPFNIASYGLLLEIIAKAVNMVPDELIGNLGDCHIYSNQIDGVKEQIGRELSLEERGELFKKTYPNKSVDDFKPMGMEVQSIKHQLDTRYNNANIPKRTREPYPLPTLKIENEVKWMEGNCLPYYSSSDFTIENYESHTTIKIPLSN